MSNKEIIEYPEGYKRPDEIWGEMAELSKAGVGITQIIGYAREEFAKTRQIWLEYVKSMDTQVD